jgi:hypothetical protein
MLVVFQSTDSSGHQAGISDVRVLSGDTTQGEGDLMQDNERKPEKVWKAHGLKCKVILTEMGHRCGYVGVSKNSPAYGRSYDDIPAQVHGGLTYAAAGTDNLFYLGFDCAHYDDWSKYHQTGHKWTLEEVVAETEQLAEQLAKLTIQDIIREKIRWWPDDLKDYLVILDETIQNKEKVSK